MNQTQPVKLKDRIWNDSKESVQLNFHLKVYEIDSNFYVFVYVKITFMF